MAYSIPKHFGPPLAKQSSDDPEGFLDSDDESAEGDKPFDGKSDANFLSNRFFLIPASPLFASATLPSFHSFFSFLVTCARHPVFPFLTSSFPVFNISARTFEAGDW